VTLPLAFLVVGPAGSGKSTVAREIARRARAAYLDKDAIAGPLVELLLASRGDDPWERDENAFYQESVFAVEYDTVLAVAAQNLALGLSVVIDAPFRQYTGDGDYLTRARRRLGWPEATVVVVHVDVPAEVHRSRLVARGNDRDRWKLDHWDEFRSELERDRCRWADAVHVRVDNTGPDADLSALAPFLTT
jgi:predicted kinase